jgi:hypothetical protein
MKPGYVHWHWPDAFRVRLFTFMSASNKMSINFSAATLDSFDIFLTFCFRLFIELILLDVQQLIHLS